MKKLLFFAASLVLIACGIIGYLSLKTGRPTHAIEIASWIMNSHVVSENEPLTKAGEKDVLTPDGHVILSWDEESPHNASEKSSAFQVWQIYCGRYRNGARTLEVDNVTLVQVLLPPSKS